MYYSDDRQDEFVANLLKFKRDGTYVDIGSCASVGSNNSYFFESLGWRGICIEKDPQFNSSYETRTCKFLNEDATTIDYRKLFEDQNFPKSIDYLSLDVDAASTEVLAALPLDDYRFKVITIEHDSHVYGDKYKGPQRAVLLAAGYFLLGDGVLNQSGRNIGAEHAWEDWWIWPALFSPEELARLYSKNLFTDQIIAKLK